MQRELGYICRHLQLLQVKSRERAHNPFQMVLEENGTRSLSKVGLIATNRHRAHLLAAAGGEVHYLVQRDNVV